jgi:peptide/nickel transport system substrate-binding protein
MKRIAATLLALAAAGPLTGCPDAKNAGTGGTGTGEPAAATGTLIFGRGSDSVTLDPPLAQDGESVAVIDNVFDSLVRYSDDATKIEPCLAEKWERSADGKTWTFELAKNVKFHDGSPFDAEAVVFTFERLLKDDHPFHNKDFVNVELFKPVTKVEAKGPHTVVFTLSRPVAAFLGNLTIYTARIVPPAALKKLGAAGFAEKPVGTGAFSFKSWQRDQKIVLEANKDYFLGRPLVDQVVLVAIKENATRMNMLKAGKLHIMDGVSPVIAGEVEQDKDLTLLRQTGMNVGYLAFNCEKKPFDDPKVRRALALAVDPARIVATNFQGMGTVARNPMPPFIFAWDGSAPEPAARKDEAKKLLAEAGVKDLRVELLHMSTPRPYLPEPKQTALVVQDDLKQIGVEVTLATMDWGQYLVKTREGHFEACLMGWTGDTSDADNFLYVLLGKDNIGSTNVARFQDASYNDLCLAAQSELDEAKRKQLYLDAQKLVRDVRPMVPLVHADGLAACRKNVKNMKLHPTGRREFRQVSLDK